MNGCEGKIAIDDLERIREVFVELAHKRVVGGAGGALEVGILDKRCWGACIAKDFGIVCGYDRAEFFVLGGELFQSKDDESQKKQSTEDERVRFEIVFGFFHSMFFGKLSWLSALYDFYDLLATASDDVIWMDMV